MTKKKPPITTFSFDLKLPDGSDPAPYGVQLVVRRLDGSVIKKKDMRDIQASVYRHFGPRSAPVEEPVPPTASSDE